MASAVLGAFDSIKSQFTIKEVNSDNAIFKLFSKVSFGFCIIASILVGLSEYIGKPITCTQSASNSISDEHFDAHCWIHGSKHINKHFQEHFECIADQSEEDGFPDTNYYQWVVFMLALNALLFKIPSLIWKFFEGGLMKEFHSGKSVKSNLLTDDTMRTNLKTHMWYLQKLKGQQMSYYIAFMVCQLLNLAMLTANWWATDKFLSGNFHTYGSDVMYYYRQDSSYRRNSDNPSPMCNAFPTKVSCTMNYVGTGDGTAKINGLCLLSQNIINEKIYLFLWFWFVLMGILGSAQLVFEVAILAIPNIRGTLIARQIGTFLSGDMKKYVQRTCSIGDWFLLYQIGKNTNKAFFYNLIEQLSLKNNSNPKRTKDIESLLQHEQCSNETIEMDEKN